MVISGHVLTDGQDCRGRVVIPPEVTKIGERAFDRARVEELVLHEGVTEIGERAFIDCDRLHTVRGMTGIKKIGTYAFGFCRALREIALPEGLEVIGDSAFYCCEALQAFHIPESTKRIEFDALGRCVSIQQLCIPEHVTVIPGAFDGRYPSLFSLQWQGVLCSDMLEDTRRAPISLLLRTSDFKIPPMSNDFETLLLVHECFHTPGAAHCIRALGTRIAEHFIRTQNISAMTYLLRSTEAVTTVNIDMLLESAIQHETHEVYLLLLEHKRSVTGFQDITDLFRL